MWPKRWVHPTPTPEGREQVPADSLLLPPLSSSREKVSWAWGADDTVFLAPREASRPPLRQPTGQHRRGSNLRCWDLTVPPLMFQMAALFPSPNPHRGEFSALRMGPDPHFLEGLL